MAISPRFGLQCLCISDPFLIDTTSLWSDELYSVGKSFQPSLGALVEMLREDTHPPFYYFLLWVWGQLIGQTPVTLRLFSWCAYCLGGIVMVRQFLAKGGRNMQVLTVAALLAFCSPYPVRFAIEGKSYALLLLMVALAWWRWRGGAGGARNVPCCMRLSLPWQESPIFMVCFWCLQPLSGMA